MARTTQGLTHRQERFCHAFISFGSATQAAVTAGYAFRSARNHGYRLLRTPRIRARIDAIQADLAEDACRSTEVLLGKLETLYRNALEGGQTAVAARIVALQARLGGLDPLCALPPGSAGNDDKGRQMTTDDDSFSGDSGECPFASTG